MRLVNLSEDTAAVVDQGCLRLSGQMTHAAISLIFKQWRKATQSSIDVVDLSQVTHMDSSCLALLLWLQMQRSDAQAPLRVLALPASAHDLIGLYDLTQVIDWQSV